MTTTKYYTKEDFCAMFGCAKADNCPHISRKYRGLDIKTVPIVISFVQGHDTAEGERADVSLSCPHFEQLRIELFDKEV